MKDASKLYPLARSDSFHAFIPGYSAFFKLGLRRKPFAFKPNFLFFMYFWVRNSSMFSVRSIQFQIINRIISNIVVDVVHSLFKLQESTYFALHNNPVFSYISLLASKRMVRDSQIPVSSSFYPTFANIWLRAFYCVPFTFFDTAHSISVNPSSIKVKKGIV